MRTVLLAVLAPLAALVLAGCGGGSEPPVDEPSLSVGTLTEGPVDVLVRQIYDGSKGTYVEGAYSYIRVEHPDGEQVLKERLPEPRKCPRQKCISEIRFSLPAGDYRFKSYQRPCSGNCGFLDPPSDRCERVLSVTEPITAVVTVRPGEGGCELELE